MKKAERVAAIVKILSDNPGKVYSLKYFSEMFNAAKSSLSEDVQSAKNVFEELKLGHIETTAGVGGGIKYLPYISDEDAMATLETIKEKLMDPSRQLGGGFLYTSDIMFDADLMTKVGLIFARRFMNSGADYIATIETKGIPAALMTAKFLNLPLILIRREAKVSEGSTMSINYFSGSSDRIQKMSVARRAISEGGKVVIIDDFMRAGGSIKGISEILTESGMEIVDVGLIITSREPEKKTVKKFVQLLTLDDVDKEEKITKILPNNDIFL